MAKTLEHVGLDGVINMTESPTGVTRFAMVNGLVLERGFVSPMFVETLDPEDDGNKQNIMNLVMELEQPHILVVANRIKEVSQIVPILDLLKNSGTKRPFLLFSEDLQEEPMSTMLYNNQKNILRSCAVNIPWMAGIQKDILKDICAMTGATLVDDEHEIKLEEVEMKHFGAAKMINIDDGFTHIVGGDFEKERFDQRCQEIKD